MAELADPETLVSLLKEKAKELKFAVSTITNDISEINKSLQKLSLVYGGIC